MISGRRKSTGVVTVRDMFYLSCLVSRNTYNLGYGLATYFDTMSNKSRGALCGGCYITRLAKNLGVFNDLQGLTRSSFTIEIVMDTFRSMRLMEKRGDRYVLIDGARPRKGVAGVAEVAEDQDAPVPDIPAPNVPPVHPADALARIEESQRRQEVTQRRHEIMLRHLHSQIDWQQQCMMMLMLERKLDPLQMSPAPAAFFSTSASLEPETSFAFPAC